MTYWRDWIFFPPRFKGQHPPTPLRAEQLFAEARIAPEYWQRPRPWPA